MSTSALDPARDFSLLRSPTGHRPSHSQSALLLVLLLLALLGFSGIGLVAYLQAFEAEEQIRTQSADALWLEQTVRFHLRRLEADLESLARKEVDEPDFPQSAFPALGGSLRSYEAGLLAHGWQAVGARVPPRLEKRWTRARRRPLNAQSLDSMHDVARGLRRPAYAGPLSAGNSAADEVWLCVPLFDRGEFLGSYVAVFSLRSALDLIVPGWFRKTHRVELLDPGAEIHLQPGGGASREQRFLASVDMPGSDTYLQISSIDSPQATVPRALLGVALLFLIGMATSLYFLRRDIVKRQAIEESLAAQVALRQSMEDSIDIGLFARGLTGEVLYANRAFCGIVGLRADALLGARDSLPAWPTPPLAQGEEQEAEIEFCRPDGGVVQLMMHTVPLMHATSGHIGWMTSVLDVTDRRRAEKAAQVQQQRLESAGRLVAIGEVASTLAHELNQPLGALSSFASGLLNRLSRGNIEREQIRSIVERINALAAKSGEVIRRVNAFARRREMQVGRIDLVDFLRVRHPSGVAGNVRLELRVPTHAIVVRADVVLLEQALHNVVQNAAQAAAAASQDPRVCVELAQPADGFQASISVSDNGAGIDEDARARVFDAFYSSKPDGMGMGLAICRSILEAHSGRIELIGGAVGAGACFRLWLPVDDTDGCNDTHRR